MQTENLRLELVTPLFLHGSNNEKLELRSPPFKALFRYWWRAVKAEPKPHENEGELFGSTKRRSPLLIRIPSASRSLQSDNRQPLPHRGSFNREAYLPNGTFTLQLTAPNLDSYKQIAKISFLLGGVGNRSRRGFGSIRDQKNWAFNTVDELRREVWETLEGISPSRSEIQGDRIQVQPPFPAYPVIEEINFGQPTNDVDCLLKKIGQATHDRNRDGVLGSANPRLASPIHVRVQKIGNDYVPIVTQLHSNADPKRQQDFIDAVIT